MDMKIKQAEDKWKDVLKEELQGEMDKAPSTVSSHDISHIRRVWDHVKEISSEVDVDGEILIAATFLHDIGRHYPEGDGVHGPVSAPYARDVLERIDFPSEKIESVINSIKYHDETFPSKKREKLEAKVLYDADKLDSFGAVGISRFLIFHTKRGKKLGEVADYTLENIPLRFEKLELEKARKISKEKFEYAVQYFKDLKEEIK
ncbi:MAG: HD domain-containing protein [Candidatus Aenigmatarchaeota archaeon]